MKKRWYLIGTMLLAALIAGTAGTAVKAAKTPLCPAETRKMRTEAKQADYTVDGASYSGLEKEGAFEKEGNSLLWTAYDGKVSYTFDVRKAGKYYLELEYQALESHSDYAEIAVAVNGVTVPEADSVFTLERPLVYGEIRTDEKGNQLRSRTWYDEKSIVKRMRVQNASSTSYLVLDLKQGKNEITFTGYRTDIRILSVALREAEELPSYAETELVWKNAGCVSADTDTIRIEAEQISRSSDSRISAQYDRSDAKMSPSDPVKFLLNMAGGGTWSSDGQYMEWEFQVEKAGLYELHIKERQNMKQGITVYRRLFLDGEVPFKELDCVGFTYNSSWNRYTAGGDTPYQIYLGEGTHTLRMEVIPGPLAEIAHGLKQELLALNELYRSVIMVTGTSPDSNREYNVDKEIPGLMDKIEDTLNRLKERKTEITSLSGQSSGNELIQLNTLIVQLESFLKKPESIPGRIGNFKSNIGGFATWLTSLSEQPLDIDYIEFSSGRKLEKVTAGWWENLVFGTKALIGSFFTDYESQEAKDDVLTVWIATGRDQMQIIKDMTEDEFTASTGQKVVFSLVQTGIEQAILAGSGPDIVLYQGKEIPATLAMRDALVALDELDGFDSLVEKNYFPEAVVPYEYEGHYYGLPLTQMYPMLFYRTDIMEELGLSAPDTWDELYQIIPVIQRKNMDVGVPSAPTTFGTLLAQQGIGFYNEHHTGTTFDTPEAISVFRQYTRLFSDYVLPLTYNFYERFRSGEMPVAIADYTEYGRLNVAAPEIAGLWEMKPVPGIKNEDGTINRSAMALGGQGAYILKGSKNVDAAWDFLQWFLSGDVQAEYGRKQEGLLGPSGRYPTANKEAFLKLPWLTSEAEVLMEQWKQITELPQIPGSYYVQRNLNSAFRKVVLKNENPREMLELYNNEINAEIRRKRKEFGLFIPD